VPAGKPSPDAVPKIAGNNNPPVTAPVDRRMNFRLSIVAPVRAVVRPRSI
jgi:hypothetical protein